MAKRDFFANWKVIIGEGKTRTEILPGKSATLDDTDDDVKTLVARGALTPARAQTAPAASGNSGKGGQSGK